jgi:hypothetical protein
MPRHPPCALKNLTTKIKNISREPGPNTKSGTRFYRNCFFLRCSRPLCSSQPTTPTHPPTPITQNTQEPPPKTTASKNNPEHPEQHQCTQHAQENQKQPKPHPTHTTPSTQKHQTQPTQNKALLSQDPTVCQTINPTNTHQPRFPEHQTPPHTDTHPPKGDAHPHRTRTSERTHQPAGTTRHLSIDIPPMSTHRGTNAREIG